MNEEIKALLDAIFNKDVSKEYIIINKEKKYVTLKGNDYCEKKVCHEEDTFDWVIGFGLALSLVNKDNRKYKRMRDFYRRKEKFNYKAYASWCITETFNNDMVALDEFITFIEKSLDGRNTICVVKDSEGLRLIEK